MSEQERDFGWDDEIQNDRDFTLLPKGEYPFTVLSVERARHAGSEKLPPCNVAVVNMEVNGGDMGATQIKTRLFLHSKCEGILCGFFRAIGMRAHGERLKMNWGAVAGKTGLCKLDIRQYEGREYNEVKAFLDPAPEKAAAWKQGAF